MAFMIPMAWELSEQEVRQLVYEPALADGGFPDEPRAGWYARLSAPGYLDSTDWEGPFDRAWMALRAVCDTYDVNMEGEDR